MLLSEYLGMTEDLIDAPLMKYLLYALKDEDCAPYNGCMVLSRDGVVPTTS